MHSNSQDGICYFQNFHWCFLLYYFKHPTESFLYKTLRRSKLKLAIIPRSKSKHIIHLIISNLHLFERVWRFHRNGVLSKFFTCYVSSSKVQSWLVVATADCFKNQIKTKTPTRSDQIPNGHKTSNQNILRPKLQKDRSSIGIMSRVR